MRIESPTSLNQFVTCERKYQARYILKNLETTPSPSILKGLQFDTDIDHYINTGEARNFVLSNKQYIDSVLGDREEYIIRTRVKFHIDKDFTKFYTSRKEIEDLDYIYNGELDCVKLFTKCDDKIEIIDWKTGSSPMSKPFMEDKLKQEVDIAQIMYSKAMMLKYNVKEVDCRWVYIEEQLEIRKTYHADTIDAELLLIESIALAQQQAIASDMFEPKANIYCGAKNCSIKDCEFYRATSDVKKDTVKVVNDDIDEVEVQTLEDEMKALTLKLDSVNSVVKGIEKQIKTIKEKLIETYTQGHEIVEGVTHLFTSSKGNSKIEVSYARGLDTDRIKNDFPEFEEEYAKLTRRITFKKTKGE